MTEQSKSQPQQQTPKSGDATPRAPGSYDSTPTPRAPGESPRPFGDWAAI